MAVKAKRAVPGRRSDDWQVLVVTGEQGLIELCQQVRAIWKRGGDAYLDGRITFRPYGRPVGGEVQAVPQRVGHEVQAPLPWAAGSGGKLLE